MKKTEATIGFAKESESTRRDSAGDDSSRQLVTLLTEARKLRNKRERRVHFGPNFLIDFDTDADWHHPKSRTKDVGRKASKVVARMPSFPRFRLSH